MWETGSLNWAQIMLQWFNSFSEFREFSISSAPFRKNSINLLFFSFFQNLENRISYFYRPQRSCGKVMFLHLSVILSTWGSGVHPRDEPPLWPLQRTVHTSYCNAFLLGVGSVFVPAWEVGEGGGGGGVHTLIIFQSSPQPHPLHSPILPTTPSPLKFTKYSADPAC